MKGLELQKLVQNLDLSLFKKTLENLIFLFEEKKETNESLLHSLKKLHSLLQNTLSIHDLSQKNLDELLPDFICYFDALKKQKEEELNRKMKNYLNLK